MLPLTEILLVVQAVAAVVLLGRLARGRTRPPPLAPLMSGELADGISVIVPTLNEAHRIGPLLEGVLAQGAPVREIIFVDSGSTDGSRERIAVAAAGDARVRIERDPPLA